MANVKISDLTPTTFLQTTDLLVIAQDNGVDYDTRSLPASLIESASKRVFICDITQSGVSAPSIGSNIYRDNFGGFYSTNYVSVGVYEILGFNSELGLDCEFEINSEVITPTHSIYLVYTAANTLEIRTYDATNTLTDGILSGNNIVLKVTRYL
jgi:hypothetical protein